MLCVPFSLRELLALFTPWFTAPSFRTFQAMVVGQIAQTHLRARAPRLALEPAAQNVKGVR